MGAIAVIGHQDDIDTLRTRFEHLFVEPNILRVDKVSCSDKRFLHYLSILLINELAMYGEVYKHDQLEIAFLKKVLKEKTGMEIFLGSEGFEIREV